MPSFDETVKELVELAEGSCDDALDELVQFVCDTMASTANNKGFEGQIRFLLVHMGQDEDTLRIIKERLEETADGGDS
jgi:hypothetical protein